MCVCVIAVCSTSSVMSVCVCVCVSSVVLSVMTPSAPRTLTLQRVGAQSQRAPPAPAEQPQGVLMCVCSRQGWRKYGGGACWLLLLP